MAEEKPHEATPHKRNQAAQKGQGWQSPDAQSALSLLLAMSVLSLYVKWASTSLLDGFRQFIKDMAHSPEARQAIPSTLHLWFTIIIPMAVGIVIWNLFTHLLLKGFRIHVTAPKLDFSKISFTKGIGRIFSANTLWETGKGFIKLSILTVIVVVWFAPKVRAFAYLSDHSLNGAVSIAGQWMTLLGVLLAMSYLILSIFDIMWQRRRHSNDLKMTTQELRDESKNSDGNPQVRQWRRQAQARLLKQGFHSVKEATVVITNPTHVAVAIAWDDTQDNAPTVVAKGVDETALIIRQLANEHHIPIVEEPPLARSLVATPIGSPIPEDHWRAVAVILAYIMRRSLKE